jgi:cytochrome c oxidase assembly protein subunit 15
VQSKYGPANRNVHRFAVFTAICTFFLLIAGALVTSNDAGLSVPDWPLSYGSLLPPMVGGIFYEHGHRMIAATVGFLTIIQAIWLWRVEDRRWVRNLGLAALGLVIAQGVLGGVTVYLMLKTSTSSAHATLAQLFFATQISIAFFTGPWWRSELSQLDDPASPHVRLLTVLTSLAILLQILLGAIFRHNGFGILPHLIGAAVVTVLVVYTGRVIKKRFANVRPLRRGVTWLHSTFGTQLLLGGAAYWAVLAARNAVQPEPLYVTLTVVHVVAGAVTFGVSILLMLACFRMVRPAGTLELQSSTQRAAI